MPPMKAATRATVQVAPAAFHKEDLGHRLGLALEFPAAPDQARGDAGQGLVLGGVLRQAIAQALRLGTSWWNGDSIRQRS